ncbi:MAG: hypothetical protein ABW001_14995 [Mycobacterium sp.]
MRHFLDQTFEVLRLPGVRSALRSLKAESQRDPDLLQRFRAGFLERRLDDAASLAALLSSGE